MEPEGAECFSCRGFPTVDMPKKAEATCPQVQAATMQGVVDAGCMFCEGLPFCGFSSRAMQQQVKELSLSAPHLRMREEQLLALIVWHH